MNRPLRAAAVVSLLGWMATGSLVRAAEAASWSLDDGRLRAVKLDHSPTESFLAVCADSTGNLFVGGREALFVYDAGASGEWTPRRELLRLPPDSWIYDIQIRGDDVYLLTVSALYVAPGARIKREGVEIKRLIWGVPLGHVHQCFHGMTWGPDGRLYFTMGDPLWYYGDFSRPDHWGHWTFFSQPEGTRTLYNGVGGVFRCRPDGSDFEVVARGLRNSCGLTFDANWNLFTNDNDHEGMPEGYVPGRLLHVTPHAYFSWPRGWMVSKTPQRADLLQTMYDEMGRGVPVGQTYYGDDLLPPEYRNNLLVARWGRRTVSRFPLQSRGASFGTQEHVLLQGADLARPVHVAVGRGGRLFVSIAYMPQNEGSPVYPSDLVMIEPVDAAGKEFDRYDATQATPDRLWKELSSTSWHRRLRAHVEIERCAPELLKECGRRLEQVAAEDPARLHLPWLAVLSGDPSCQQAVAALCTSPDAAVRLQAVRALSLLKDAKHASIFENALEDENPQLQLAGLAAWFDLQASLPVEKTAKLARSTDTYLRQTASMLLAERGTVEDLHALCKADDPPGRLAGVLAAGFRLTLPPVSAEIDPELPLADFRSESVYVIDYADGQVDLRDHGRIGNYTMADHWKLGRRSTEQERLFQILAERLEDDSEPVRLQAGYFLSLLRDERSEPRIAQVVAESEDRKLMAAPITSVESVWLAGPFPDRGKGLEAVHPPETGAVNLSQHYRVGEQELAWQTVHRQDFSSRFYNLGLAYGPRDDSSHYAYFRLESTKRQPALLLVGSDDGVKIWHNGSPVWTNDVERGALPFQDAVKIQLQPGGNDILMRVHNRKGEYGFYLHYRAMPDVKYSLPEKLDFAGLAERLKSAGSEASVSAEFFEVDWEQSLAKGDKVRGRQLYSADGLGCAKCHALDEAQAGNNGPSLADAAKRFTIPYLVESVLIPSKKISPVFRATLIATVDGEQLTGLVVGETAEKVELLLRDAQRRTIPTSVIAQRRLLEASPMPHGLVKKPEELRDLLSYLLDP